MDPSSGPLRPSITADAELELERDGQSQKEHAHDNAEQHLHQHQQGLPSAANEPAVGSTLEPATPAAVDSAVVARDDAEDKLLTPPDAAALDTAPVATHLARFEFSDRGTKILMVEWYPGAAATTASALAGQDTNSTAGEVSRDEASAAGDAVDNASAAPARVPSSPVVDAAVWEVSWPGKSTFLPARDTDENDARRRVYFMLPPEAQVPPTVTIARPGRASLILKPLPAIFPEHFQAESGPRGVLHTIWAKKRLRELELEMEAEMRANAESVGLEMALAEKQWIVDNFLRAPAAPAPTSPRSPVSGRLGDKLKGLRLATSPADLVPSPAANTFTTPDSQSHMLSPLGGDIAVSSFSAISRSRPSGPISLDAALSGDMAPLQSSSNDAEDGLFAMPMSPRSPDMIKSPFSALGPGL
ncbi:uncharacterized protein TrAtP1_003904 [Trichoderma atroviride]|uniref:Uncharacterized protein n=1 Tax=Hypocrea atroviridis (strain ATCC 20476 / IMI 206040) TaxID=452589 RepID=G9P638_HYPAI|nr:uncharacterized protein TRIATDRAFT_226435 [Trichoderma atroviride IMI 206040]EHK40589.1 hypothetical protein TRIATDRAFT_226435 [Trichoderma atroviride IMI 206040]UKZ62665.1 hypothetical protein TrAtP1_003904 [Trichoderma atroviride]